MSQIKEAVAEAKKEQSENQNEINPGKQSFGQKVVGVIVLIAIIIDVGFVIFSNLDTLLLPKNSITISITDENGEMIDGLKVNIQSETGVYSEDFETSSNITILDAEPGKYLLSVDEIPDGYFCSTLVDYFTLEQDAKVKLEYECVKEN